MTIASETKSVDVENLSKTFGSFAALQNVSFAITEGSTVALLGPSGCGKTTILRCLAGLELPDSGVIQIGEQTVYNGRAGTNLPPERRNVGVVFQSYAIWPHMSVAENIGFPLKLRGVSKATIFNEVTRLLDMVGLSSARDKMATQLSGGQQQRVAIARALISAPRLVLFDEALSNLDAQMREQMRMELQLLQARIGFTALYVTHDQTEAFALAEHVIVMNRGSIETSGHPEHVFRNPATPFVAEFMGLNMLAGTATPPERAGCASFTLGAASLTGKIAGHDRIEAGAPIVLGIRKEHLSLQRHDCDLPGEDFNSIEGEVVASSFLGVSREYLLKAGSVEIKAISDVHDHKIGDRVRLNVRKDNVLVYSK